MAQTAKKRGKKTASTRRAAPKRKKRAKKKGKAATRAGRAPGLKRIVRHGNSMAVVLNKSLLAQAGVTEDTPLRISATPGAIRIERADVGFTPERMAEMLETLRSDPEFVRMLENLAK